MLIGEVAKKSGLSREGVRYYEKLGLIRSRPRKAGSRFYRDYNEDTLQRLSHIRLGKRLGYSLRELQPLLETLLSDKLGREKRMAFLVDKLHEVEEQIADLQAARVELITLMGSSDPDFVEKHLKEEGLWLE